MSLFSCWSSTPLKRVQGRDQEWGSWWRLLLVTNSNLLQKICAWLHVLPLHKITYILTFPPTSLEQFLRAIWNAVSQAIVLILPQIKLNSQLSCCAFFSVDHFHHMLFIKNKSQWPTHTQEEDITQCMDARKPGSFRPSWNMATTFILLHIICNHL